MYSMEAMTKSVVQGEGVHVLEYNPFVCLITFLSSRIYGLLCELIIQVLQYMYSICSVSPGMRCNHFIITQHQIDHH